jgi:hypothetical protein
MAITWPSHGHHMACDGHLCCLCVLQVSTANLSTPAVPGTKLASCRPPLSGQGQDSTSASGANDGGRGVLGSIAQAVPGQLFSRADNNQPLQGLLLLVVLGATVATELLP